jgi:hypothetical protein
LAALRLFTGIAVLRSRTLVGARLVEWNPSGQTYAECFPVTAWRNCRAVALLGHGVVRQIAIQGYRAGDRPSSFRRCTCLDRAARAPCGGNYVLASR